MSQRPLDGQVAIATGAGRGIGRSIALTLARNGATVSLAARTGSELRMTRSDIEAACGQAASFQTDISHKADVVCLVRNTVERFGRLDIVVNNHGT